MEASSSGSAVWTWAVALWLWASFRVPLCVWVSSAIISTPQKGPGDPLPDLSLSDALAAPCVHQRGQTLSGCTPGCGEGALLPSPTPRGLQVGLHDLHPICSTQVSGSTSYLHPCLCVCECVYVCECGGGGRVSERAHPLAALLPKGLNGSSWIRLKSGAWHSIAVSPALAPSPAVSRGSRSCEEQSWACSLISVVGSPWAMCTGVGLSGERRCWGDPPPPIVRTSLFCVVAPLLPWTPSLASSPRGLGVRA